MSDRGERLCELGFPGPLRDRLVAAVLAGQKTATSSLLLEYELESEPLPQVGDRETVVDSSGARVAVIEIVEVRVIRLGDADQRLASEEGEGFRSVAQWREAHERFWSEALDSVSLDDDTRVVVEHFRLVELDG